MNIICRDSIIEKLQNYYLPDGDYDIQYPPVLFVYGNQSTGKTLVLKKFFELSSIHHTFINCQEYNTVRGLLEAIINRSEWLLTDSMDDEYVKIDSICKFMDRLLDVDNEKSFVIVLDNAQNLRNIDVNLMRMFFNLQQLTNLNISLVLTSQLPFEKFHSKSGDIRPNVIHFQNYTKEEIVKILTEDFTKMVQKRKGLDLDSRATEDYIQIILNVFYKACKDLTELKFVCMKFWDIYWQPVQDGQIAGHETQKLWKNISKSLKTGLSNLYQRTIDEPSDVPAKIRVVDLPYYTKGLLVAAFLASYNPLKNDKRLFVKHHGKQTKRLQTVNKNAVNFDKATLTLGPKTFTVDRLLAIFCAILDEKVGITTNLISQISTLVNLRYLTYVSGENNLIDGAGRLQCNITQEKATQLSCNIGIDIKKYISAF